MEVVWLVTRHLLSVFLLSLPRLLTVSTDLSTVRCRDPGWCRSEIQSLRTWVSASSRGVLDIFTTHRLSIAVNSTGRSLQGWFGGLRRLSNFLLCLALQFGHLRTLSLFSQTKQWIHVLPNTISQASFDHYRSPQALARNHLCYHLLQNSHQKLTKSHDIVILLDTSRLPGKHHFYRLSLQLSLDFLVM